MKEGELVNSLTLDFNLDILSKKEKENESKKTKSFEEYPAQIQKDALQLLEKGELFQNIKETAQLTHANDNKLIETLILIHGSIYSGTPVQTIRNGKRWHSLYVTAINKRIRL